MTTPAIIPPTFHTVIATRFDPAAAAVAERPFGATIGEIVEQELPALPPEQRSRLVIVLVLDQEERELTLAANRDLRPPPGSTVRFHVAIGGGNILRTLLSVAIMVFAAWAGPLLFPAGGLLATLATAGIAFAGNMLLNALIPIEPPKAGDRPDPRYSIAGSRNQIAPYGKIPDNLGRIRIFPPHAAQPWTEGLRENRYTRFLLLLGYTGPVYEDWKIGDTAIEEFREYELEIYTIIPGEPWPVPGYVNPVFEINFDIRLKEVDGFQVREFPRNCDLLSVEFSCPMGIAHRDKKGKRSPAALDVAVEYAEVGSDDWTAVKVLTIYEETESDFRFGHQWLAPKVANWKARCRRINLDDSDPESVNWVALRGWRPVLPITFNKPLDVAYLRILSDEQATGMLDQISCISHAVLPDWDAETGTWITRKTQCPAAAMRRIAEGPANPEPTPVEDVDLDAHAELAEYAFAKGLTFNMSMDQKISVDEALRMPARAGRAFPTRPEGRRSLFIDRPQTVKRGIVSGRNAVNFGGEPSYPDPVDAFRVAFLDEENDFKRIERIVPRPGLVGAPVNFLSLDLPGFTNPTQIWKECAGRFAEIRYRWETFNAEQGLQALFAPPGGLLGAQFVTVDERQVSARVRAVEGDLVMLDEVVEFEAGESYACQFASRGGEVYVREARGAVGRTQLIELVGAGPRPDAGDVALFGRAGHVAEDVVVKEIEPLKGGRARLTMVAHAPEIEAARDEAAPDWDPIVPIDRDWEDKPPAKPIIVKVTSGGSRVDDDEDDGLPGVEPPVIVVVREGPAGGAPTDRIVITVSRGSEDVSTAEVTVGYGSAKFFAYDAGDVLTITATAYSLFFEVPSAATDPVLHTVMETDEQPPEILDFTVDLLAGRRISLSWQTDDVSARARLKLGGPTALYVDMVALHSGYVTAAPFDPPLQLAPGFYRAGMVLQNEETGLASEPAYTTTFEIEAP